MLGYRNNQKVTTVHWAAFRNATKHWIQEKPDGLLCFRHQSLRNAVEHKLLGEEPSLRKRSGANGRERPTFKRKPVWDASSVNVQDSVP